ncbi:BGTF surface domain-containing protein [Halorhabdus sp. BNX81]|uniref:BGTF surface domain-containing protein n=1 Tax=Halorhabdus sp. BNX81 TaxID=2980181 RepID=UPI0023DD52F1|nr:BGTF surface domain-containing protein [Halorhabdus sp. BNX81]WEL20681.1 S-layer protein SlaB [Halorhabdus sp. BNX81]
MTDTTEKLRALFLTALMVFSVFAGTVAFSGAAAAANTGSAPAAEATGAVSYYADNTDDTTTTVEVAFNTSINSANATEFNVSFRGDDVGDNGMVNATTAGLAIDGATADNGAVDLTFNGSVNPVNITQVGIESQYGLVNSTVDVTQTTTTIGESAPSASDQTAYKGERIALVADDPETVISIAENGTFLRERGTGTNSDVLVVETSDLADTDTGYNFTFDPDGGATTYDLSFDPFDFSASISDTEITQDDGTTTLSAESNRIDRKVAFQVGDVVEFRTIGSDGQASADFTAEDLAVDTLSAEAVHLDTGIIVDLGDVTVNEKPDTNLELGSAGYQETAGDIVEIDLSITGTDQVDLLLDGEGFDEETIDVTDGDGDGSVTVLINTYTGTASAEGDDDSATLGYGEPIYPGTFTLFIAQDGDDSGAAEDAASLNLRQPELEGATVLVGPEGHDAFDGSNYDDDATQVAAIEGNTTEASEVANDNTDDGYSDEVVVAFDASGVFGAIEAGESTAAGINWSVEEAVQNNPGDIGGTVLASDDNDRIYFILDKGELEDKNVGQMFDGTLDINADRNTYWDNDGDVSASFEFVDADASPNTVEEPYQIVPGEDSEIRGSANVAPGSEFDVRVLAGGSLAIAENVVVSEDGTWNVSYDFSDRSVGDNATITVSAAYGVEVDAVFADTPEWETSGNVAQLEQRVSELETLLNETTMMLEQKNATIEELRTQVNESGGASQELLEQKNSTIAELESQVLNQTTAMSDLQEQLDSLNLSVQTLEANNEDLQSLLDEKNSTIEDLNEQLESDDETTTTGGPGFTAVIALVALMGAALLAVRRQQ